MLADLIHHCRADLTLPQLSRIIHIYSTNIHDPTLAAAIQTMCSKLLLNLIDPIAAKESTEAIKVLQRIMVGFVSKMEAMAEVRDDWTKWAKTREPLSVVLAGIKAREAADDKKKAEIAAEVATEVDTEMASIVEVEKEDDDKMKVDEDKMKVDQVEIEVKDTPEVKDSKKRVEEVEEKSKVVEEEPLVELDDVDIERAKPIRREVLMVDPGPDPIKGTASFSAS